MRSLRRGNRVLSAECSSLVSVRMRTCLTHRLRITNRAGPQAYPTGDVLDLRDRCICRRGGPKPRPGTTGGLCRPFSCTPERSGPLPAGLLGDKFLSRLLRGQTRTAGVAARPLCSAPRGMRAPRRPQRRSSEHPQEHWRLGLGVDPPEVGSLPGRLQESSPSAKVGERGLVT